MLCQAAGDLWPMASHDRPQCLGGSIAALLPKPVRSELNMKFYQHWRKADKTASAAASTLTSTAAATLKLFSFPPTFSELLGSQQSLPVFVAAKMRLIGYATLDLDWSLWRWMSRISSFNLSIQLLCKVKVYVNITVSGTAGKSLGQGVNCKISVKKPSDFIKLRLLK